MLFGAGIVTSLAGSSDNSKNVYDFVVNDIDGKEVSLEKYRGKVLLIVNVASKCGYTPQYEGLQEIYTDYREFGFAVLGFPANNFKGQEPGSNQEIKKFCQTTYGVEFPMFSKISVKGEDMHPLYQFLTSEEGSGEFAGEITWNFNKFLVGPTGKVINRFSTRDEPTGKDVITAIEAALK
jgi:glutathione peroxidase